MCGTDMVKENKIYISERIEQVTKLFFHYSEEASR